MEMFRNVEKECMSLSFEHPTIYSPKNESFIDRYAGIT